MNIDTCLRTATKPVFPESVDVPGICQSVGVFYFSPTLTEMCVVLACSHAPWGFALIPGPFSARPLLALFSPGQTWRGR